MVFGILLLDSRHLYLLTTIELISGQFAVLFTSIVIIGLVNTIWGMPITPIVVVGNAELWLKFLTTETPLDSLPNFGVNPISTPLLTTSLLGTTIVSTPMVIIPTSSDWVTPIPTCCFQVSTTTTSNTIGEVVLMQDQWCYNLRLPINIHYGVVCGCEYPSSFLLMVGIDGQIYQLYGPN